MLKIIQYFKDRLNETSTYLMITMGGITASALSAPWSFVVFGVHVAAAFLADKKVTEDVLAKLK